MNHHDRLTLRDGALLVVDAQDKLMDRIHEAPTIIARALMLIKAAAILDVLAVATEQYPKGLGPTVAPIAELIPRRPEKTAFHCCAAPELLEQLYGRKIKHVLIAGIESHICVAQTALELMKLGFVVQVAADATGSRRPYDRDVALRRLEHAGAVVTTAEAAIFEWIETADHPRFKEISRLVKEADAP